MSKIVTGIATYSQDLLSDASTVSQIRMTELTGNGSLAVGFKPPADITSETIWQLPAADGSADEVMVTNASGVLSFAPRGEINVLGSAGGTSLTGTKVGSTLNIKGITVDTSTILSVTANANDVEIGITQTNITATGALDGGSITSNFGSINNGASAITTTGTITGGVVDADNLRLDANTISSTDTNGNISILPDGTGEVLLKADPVSSLGAVTKQYADSLATGLSFKDPVRLKTTLALPAYTKTGAGVGAYLEADANGVISNVFDAVTVADGDRVLVDSFGSASDVDNGIYVVTTVGTAGTPWRLTRATDADDDAEVDPGLYVLVTEGVVEGDTSWVISSDAAITVDTTAITFSKFSGSGTGEVNTASNVGTGEGVFKVKAGSDLQFRSITATSSKITLTNNTNDIGVDVNQANITGTGALASGSIATGFGTIVTANAITGASLTADQVNINDGKVTFSGATTANQLVVPDNLADALRITDGTQDYLSIVSTTGSDEVQLLQDVSIASTMNLSLDGGYLSFADIAAPANPGAGLGLLYKKTGDDGLFWKPDAAGAEIDITASNGAILDGGNTTGSTLVVGTNDSNTLAFETNGTTEMQILTGGEVEILDANPLRFYETGSADYVAFKAGTLAASTTWTLPVADGAAEECLRTDGAGALSWSAITTMPVSVQSGTSYTLLATDQMVEFSNAAAVAVTLPVISATKGDPGGPGRYYILIKTNAAATTVTISANVANGIDTIAAGSASVALTSQYDRVVLVSNGQSGGRWYTV